MPAQGTYQLPQYIVAVGGLVRHPDGRVLMLRGPRHGDWEFPGGQVEEGETLTQALRREVWETGVQVEVETLIGVYSNLRQPQPPDHIRFPVSLDCR